MCHIVSIIKFFLQPCQYYKEESSQCHKYFLPVLVVDTSDPLKLIVDHLSTATNHFYVLDIHNISEIDYLFLDYLLH